MADQNTAAAIEQLRQISAGIRNLTVASTANTNLGSVDASSGDVTLNSTQSALKYYTVVGALTVNRNVIVPNNWEGGVYNNTTGAFSVTWKTASGSGVAVAQTKRAFLFADGTNVVRMTSDV
jgi:hypothetical protein